MRTQPGMPRALVTCHNSLTSPAQLGVSCVFRGSFLAGLSSVVPDGATIVEELALLALMRKRLRRRRARCRLSVRRVLKDAGIALRPLRPRTTKAVLDGMKNGDPRGALQSQQRALIHHQLRAIAAIERRLRSVEARIAAHVGRLCEASSSSFPHEQRMIPVDNGSAPTISQLSLLLVGR